MDRRAFLRRAGTGVAVLGTLEGAALLGCRAWVRRDTRPEEPSAHQLETLRAMAETFLPAGEGSPGATDTNALAAIVDPVWGVSPYLSEVVADLDDWCFIGHGGQRFVDLGPTDRERALEERMGDHGRLIQSWYQPVYEGILALTKLSFFGGLANAMGTNFVGFPGASTGYAATSAAGAYHATDTPRRGADGKPAVSTIMVGGDGRVSALRVSALVTGVTGAETLTMRLTTPAGAHHALAAPRDGGGGGGGGVGEPGRVVLHDLAVSAAHGAIAAGAWRLEIRGSAGEGAPLADARSSDARAQAGAELRFWSFTLRTDLDERA